MKLESRLTNYFCEIKVDVVEETIFKNSQEPMDTVENLISVIEDLCKLTDREFTYKITES